MAYTSLYRPDGSDTRPRRYRLIKNSEVIKVGDFITDEQTGAANVDAVTEPIMGFVTAIVTNNKVSVASASAGSTSGYASATQTFTAPADNQTVGMVMAEYVPIREGDQILATLSAAKGTTTGSNVEGYNLAVDVTNSARLDEATAATTTTNKQFRIINPYTQGSTTQVVVECIVRQSE